MIFSNNSDLATQREGLLTERSVQNANCVVMVPPKEFCYNAETAQDNEFQHKIDLSNQLVRSQTMAEFANMVAGLRREGVQVVEFDYPFGEVETPDAVFPNNWFSTTSNGELFVFPMACHNRQHEVRPEALIKALSDAGREVVSQDSLVPYADYDAYLKYRKFNGTFQSTNRKCSILMYQISGLMVENPDKMSQKA